MIKIFMATYNGEKYIKEQIESIINQTITDWTLYIHDDGSKDDTIEIIKSIKDPRIFLIEDSIRYGDSSKNFLSMVKKYADTDYFCFSDQDDVWLPTKLEDSLTALRKIENNSEELPFCIGTDLKVVNQELKVISDSFYNFSKINVDSTFNTLMLENSFTGCTMMMNGAVSRYIKQIDLSTENIIQHDWLIALICAADGGIGQLKKQTMLYRQHFNNVVGAKKFSILKFMLHPSEIFKSYKRVKILRFCIYKQLIFCTQYISNKKNKKILDFFVNSKGIKHKVFILRYKLYKSRSLIKSFAKFIFY